MGRIGWGVLGVVGVVSTFGVPILCESITKLFTQDKVKIRYAIPVAKSSNLDKGNHNNLQSEDVISMKELARGVNITNDKILGILQPHINNVIEGKEEGGVKLYNSGPSNRQIFSLKQHPKYIFKMSQDGSMVNRYTNMIWAQTVCRTHALGLLVIPSAKLFMVEGYQVIVEEKLDFSPSESAQEQDFEKYASSLNETIRQLALFICKTGYCDVEWRNNPVLNNPPDLYGCRTIGLIDLEHMDNARIGLFGEAVLERRGLVKCVTKQQGLIVKRVAKESGVSTSDFASAQAERTKEINGGQQLKQFYLDKGIITGNEPIEIDFDQLDFSNYGKTAKTRLKNLTRKLVKKINEHIRSSGLGESIKGKRYVHIDINSTFKSANKLIKEGKTSRDFADDEDYYNATFLVNVINKLLDMQVLYKLVCRNGHGYYIQA